MMRMHGRAENYLIYLPNELILYILEEHALSCNDLVSLATVSRRLHDLALEALFVLHKIDTSFENVSLQCKDDSIQALPGLAISLSAINATVVRLSCDLTSKFDSPDAMILEARALTRFVSKVASVQEVSLQLMNPPSILWEEVLLGLLDLILLKSCTTLSVKTLESSSWAVSESRSHLLKWPTSLPRMPKSFSLKQKPTPSLRVCHTQALPRFMYPFYERTLNLSSITDLSFKYTFNSEDWATFSSHIVLPSLSQLSISHCAILATALQKFLIRHPTIACFDFHHNMLMPVHPPRLPEGVLPKLKRLQTSSDYITRYLPALDTFAELSSITTPIGDKFHGFSHADDVLSCIALCSNDLTASLEFANVAGLEAWLHGRENSQTVLLPCVKTLELNTLARHGLSDAALRHLPKWLASFPGLDHVSISHLCFRTVEADQLKPFIQAIGVACPHIKTFRLRSDVDWCHTFPSGIDSVLP